MTQLPNEQELKELKLFKKPRCLSMYIRFDDTNSVTGPGRVELKNALREAATLLINAGIKPKDTETFLQPARALLDQRELWMPHHGGLAIFLHPLLFKYYLVPNGQVTSALTVGRGFVVEPLERIVQDNQHYFVLALSHKNVHLYEGDRYQLRLLELKDFPNDVNSSLMIDDYQKERGLHAVGPLSLGKGSEVSHEQYEVSKEQKQMLLGFFRNIDHRFKELFGHDKAPLVIGGVGYLLPIYRKANTYAGLLKEAIPGNLEETLADDIRQKAWRLVKRATA